MTEWKPEGPDRPGSDPYDETTRIPAATGHPYGAPNEPSATEDTARFGGLGFHGDQPPPPSHGSGADGGDRGPRRGRGLGAALLVGALVVGGVGGVLGSVGYRLADDPSPSTSSATAAPSSSAVDTRPAGTSSAGQESVQAVAARVLPSVVKINVANDQEQGSGSGIVISSDGEILTNNHVASVAGQSGQISVSFNDGTAKKARIIGTDPVTDLAVIKAEGVSGLTPATIGASSRVAVGEEVVAIGSPFGLQATVTSGIVSALNRPVSVSSADQSNPGVPQAPTNATDTTYPAIQTDAAINPGNSGGPLVDLNGDVVGINSSIRTASDASGLSSSPGGSIGLGFAIPIEKVWPVVQQLRNGETPTHARIGVSVTNASSQGGLLTGAGITAVSPGAAAAKAGLKKGDVITKVDSDAISGSESLVATIRGHRPGETVTLTVVTGSQPPRLVKVTLDSDAKS